MVKRLFHTYRQSYIGLPVAAWMLSLVMLVNRSGSVVLFFLTLYLTSELDFSVAEAGALLSLYGLGSMAGAYAGGWLSDAWGTKRVQISSLLLAGLGFILLGYIKSPQLIGGMLFVQALIGESLRPANATALAAVLPPSLRARGFALNRLAINLGVSIGPAIGGFLARFEYLLLFWADGITCIIAGGLLWYFFHGEEFEGRQSGEDVQQVNVQPWKDGIFLMMLLLLLASGVVFVQLFSTWPVYLREVYCLLEDQIGLLMALNGLMIVLLEMPLIHRLENHRPLLLVSVGALLLFGGFAILPLADSFFFAVFTVIIWTTGEMLMFPIISSFIANRASEQQRGKYMGMFSFTFALAFVLGPLLGPWVYDAFSPSLLWILCGVLGILVSGGYWLLDRRMHALEEGGAAGR